jgi:hypothetical protein
VNLLKNIVLNQCASFFNSNPPLRFTNHTEIKCVTFSKLVDYRNIQDFFKRDNFIIATHYWEALEYPQIKSSMQGVVKKECRIFSLREIVGNV